MKHYGLKVLKEAKHFELPVKKPKQEDKKDDKKEDNSRELKDLEKKISNIEDKE